eukprot:9459638-Pyramimonas_sp.AAC.1
MGAQQPTQKIAFARGAPDGTYRGAIPISSLHAMPLRVGCAALSLGSLIGLSGTVHLASNMRTVSLLMLLGKSWAWFTHAACEGGWARENVSDGGQNSGA